MLPRRILNPLVESLNALIMNYCTQCYTICATIEGVWRWVLTWCQLQQTGGAGVAGLRWFDPAKSIHSREIFCKAGSRFDCRTKKKGGR